MALPAAIRVAGYGSGRSLRVAHSPLDLTTPVYVIAKVIDTEGQLYDITLTGAREDAFRSPNQLYEKLASVGSEVAASSAVFRPTDQHVEVHGMSRIQLDTLKQKFGSLVANDLSAFAAKAAKLGLTMPVMFEQDIR
jgi:hypothetical protein